VADDTPHQLEARSRHYNAVSVTIPVAMQDAAAAELLHNPKIAAVEKGPVIDGAVTLLVMPKDGAAIVGDVGATLRARQWPFDQIRVEHGRLDDVFRTLTLPQPH
ncbi:MAG: ABC transporter ATP-binding protein, partial [Alphaproteobacteria bacterium]|nr:ABC transporter ATP-binding protein [Alphaproteobacteria bacterium]